MSEHPRLLVLVKALMAPQFCEMIESGEPVVIKVHVFPDEVKVHMYTPIYHNEALPPAVK